jgi:hypothetical protein
MYEAVEIPEVIKVDGKTRQTRNNLGRLIHPTLEGIVNFWKWFGNSKSVDAQKRPIIYYHGTNKSFDEFNVDAGVGASKGAGSFFTSSEDVAGTYTHGVNGGNILPVYLKMDNPVVIDAKGANWNTIGGNAKLSYPDIVKKLGNPEDDELYRELGGGDPDELPKEKLVKGEKTTLKKKFPRELVYDDDYSSTNDMAIWSRREGHSSLIIKNIKDSGPSGVLRNEESQKPMTICVIFDPKLVKSATGNNGSFSSSSNVNQE